jgi:epoxyqueuosine reductase QueG
VEAKEHMRGLTEEIKQASLQKGADLVGIAPIERLQAAPQGHRPQDLLPGAQSVVVIALRCFGPILYHAPIDLIWSHLLYIRERAENVAYDIARMLEDRGYRAYPVSADDWVELEQFMGPISHKHAAVEAGLGAIGRQSLLITPQYGPRVALDSVITEAPLVPDPRYERCFCRGCRACVDACPAGAVLDFRINKALCYIWPNEHLLPMWAHGYAVCIECLKACPVGR